MFSVAMLLLVTVAAVGSGAMVAIIAWLLHRIKQLESGGGAGSAVQLSEIQEQLDALRDDIALMDERLEFAERLLEPGNPRSEP